MDVSTKVQSFGAVEVAGIYECMNCFSAEHSFAVGQRAPLCDNCKRQVTWVLQRASAPSKRESWPVIN